MSAFEIFGLIITVTICAPVVIYYVARVVFTAYFITRDYHEKRKSHGTR